MVNHTQFSNIREVSCCVLVTFQFVYVCHFTFINPTLIAGAKITALNISHIHQFVLQHQQSIILLYKPNCSQHIRRIIVHTHM